MARRGILSLSGQPRRCLSRARWGQREGGGGGGDIGRDAGLGIHAKRGGDRAGEGVDGRGAALISIEALAVPWAQIV